MDPAADVHGPWRPLAVGDVVALFSSAPFRWFLAGGHALELAAGRSWRTHDDLDVGVRRDQLAAVHEHLADWDLHVAAAGSLAPWDGGDLTSGRSQNNIWVRRDAASPWALDLLVGGGDDDAWWSRREPSIRLAWHEAVRHEGEIPYLAPHVQLLMKSKDARPKDDLDARTVLPLLSDAERRWLVDRLTRTHPWRAVAGGPGR